MSDDNDNSKEKFIRIKGADNKIVKYKIIDQYMYCETADFIDKGSFGSVFRGYHVPGQPGSNNNDKALAIKIQNINQYNQSNNQNLDQLKGDIIALKVLKHPNIVRLYDIKRKKDNIYMIMEYCNQRDLEYFLKDKQSSELEIRYLFAQILEAFKLIHMKQLMHRDIKPKNILVNNGQIKVGDFGFAKKYQKNREISEEYCGTFITVAPQVILGEYSPKCDIYSLGCTLYWMIYKTYLYSDLKLKGNLFELLKRMEENKFNFPDTPIISKELKNVLTQMLQYDEEDRISWQELFKTQIFDIQRIIQQGNFNVIELINYENLDLNQIDQEYQQAEAETLKHLNLQEKLLDPREFEDDDITKMEKDGQEHLRKVDEKERGERILYQIINHLTFEKGICLYIRSVYKRVTDYLSGFSQNIFSNYEQQDLLKLIQFGLAKFELIHLQYINQTIKSEKPNSFQGVCMDDWQVFLNNEQERMKILEILEREFYFLKNYNYLNTKNQCQQMNMIPLELDYSIKGHYLSDNFEIDEKFMIFFYNLIIQFINRVVRNLEDYYQKLDLSNTFNRVRDLVFLVDDFLILLNLEKTFVWDENRQINYNYFLEQRRAQFNNEESFKNIYKRVIEAIDLLFKNQ